MHAEPGAGTQDREARSTSFLHQDSGGTETTRAEVGARRAREGQRVPQASLGNIPNQLARRLEGGTDLPSCGSRLKLCPGCQERMGDPHQALPLPRGRSGNLDDAHAPAAAAAELSHYPSPLPPTIPIPPCRNRLHSATHPQAAKTPRNGSAGVR